MAKWNRRDFLKTTCCSAAAGFAAASFSRFGLMNALAQTATDYKAMVCVFLFGGNDSNNMVIPFSTSGYARLQIGSRRARPGAEHSAAHQSPNAGPAFCLSSPLRRDAVAVQQAAARSSGERGHADSTDHPCPIPERRSSRSHQSVFALGSGSADADLHSRQTR